MKHAANVAQVIAEAKHQAAHFEHKPTALATAANVTAASQKLDVLPPSTAASPSQQATAATAVDAHATAVGSPAVDARGTAGTSATQVSLSVDDVQQPQQQQMHLKDAVSASAIKPKTLKPITLARGSSAFSMNQAKRPALEQGVSQTGPATATHTAPVSNLAPPSPAVMTQPIVSQAATLDQPALNRPSSSISTAPDVQVSADSDIGQSQAAAAPGAATLPASAAPSTSASEQTSAAREQHPSAMSSVISKQPRAIPQITIAAGGRFGAAQPRVPAFKCQGTAAASGLVGNAPQLQEPDLAAVHRLRAQFTLPFAVAPAERQSAAAKAGKRQLPEGQEPLGEDHEDGQGSESNPAESIRAVVDALQAKTSSDGADAVQPAIKKKKGMRNTISAAAVT